MEYALATAAGLLLGVLVLLLLGFVLRWLWNDTLPEIAGLKPITTIQAVKLIFIAAILFGGHRFVTVQTTTGPAPGPGAIAAPDR